jgi:hypothetical protein
MGLTITRFYTIDADRLTYYESKDSVKIKGSLDLNLCQIDPILSNE